MPRSPAPPLRPFILYIVALTAGAILVLLNTPLPLFLDMVWMVIGGSFLLTLLARLLTAPRDAAGRREIDLVDDLLGTSQFTVLLLGLWGPVFFFLYQHLEEAQRTYKSHYNMRGNPFSTLLELGLIAFFFGGPLLLLFVGIGAIRKGRNTVVTSPFADLELPVDELGWMVQQDSYKLSERRRGMERLAANGLPGLTHLLRANIEHDEVVAGALDHLLGDERSAPSAKLVRSLEGSIGWMSDTKLELLMNAWRKSPRRNELLATLANQSKLYLESKWAEELLLVAHQNDLPGAHMAAITELSQLTGKRDVALDYLNNHGIPAVLPAIVESTEQLSFTPGLKARAREAIEAIQRRHGVELGGLSLATDAPDRLGALSEVKGDGERE